MDDEKIATSAPAKPGSALDVMKKDANAAKQLPGLFDRLAEATAVLERIKAAGEHVNLHTAHVAVLGDTFVHTPFDKPAWVALFVKDVEATIADLKARIKALGFDPG